MKVGLRPTDRVAGCSSRHPATAVLSQGGVGAVKDSRVEVEGEY